MGIEDGEMIDGWCDKNREIERKRRGRSDRWMMWQEERNRKKKVLCCCWKSVDVQKSKRLPDGVVVVGAHGRGGAAASHGELVVGKGFRGGKSGLRLHELGTWNVVVVVAAAVVAKHIDVPFSFLSHYHSRCLFLIHRPGASSATTGENKNANRERTMKG